jgi:hypothetical protein
MSELPAIDWEALAHDLSSIQVDAAGGRAESGSRSLALAAVERLLGPEQLASAVDHYIEGRPGSELARSVLWLLHPESAMLRCREIYRSGPDLNVRRSAVELLRVVADGRVLPWVNGFLDDPDAEIQAWGMLIVDQLLMGNLVEWDECETLLARGRVHSNPRVREAVAQIEQLAGPTPASRPRT